MKSKSQIEMMNKSLRLELSKAATQAEAAEHVIKALNKELAKDLGTAKAMIATFRAALEKIRDCGVTDEGGCDYCDGDTMDGCAEDCPRWIADRALGTKGDGNG